MFPAVSMRASKRGETKVVVWGSTMRAGPVTASPGARSARRKQAATVSSPVCPRARVRVPVGSGTLRAAQSPARDAASGGVEIRTDQFITSSAMPGTMRPNRRA